MSFDIEILSTIRVLEGNVFGAGGRTTVFRIETMEVTGATQYQDQVATLSANVSGQKIDLSPFNDSSPGKMLVLTMDHPLDVRFNSVSAVIISGVRQLLTAASISALYVDVGSLTTILRSEVIGGGTVQTSIPLA